MPSQDLSPLATLRVALEPYPEDARQLTFTPNESAFTAPVEVAAGELEDKATTLAGLADGTITPGAVPFGQGDGVRVNFKYTGQGANDLQLLFEIAYPGPQGYETVTAEAPVSAASQARFAAGLRQLLEDGSGTFDWTVAD
ncbi:hypothetical protein IP91_04254 [Pseudoduganella lurida]|uniref:Uncharacterized protein n=2 Tax=Pseudoduganella lurida TaxID=1036180 RepID=A0A562QZA5_9BURK|nr:hypothetical protein IP91_04254 [Pseudoduganella lurida]